MDYLIVYIEKKSVTDKLLNSKRVLVRLLIQGTF